jgi:hypothetical protein
MEATAEDLRQQIQSLEDQIRERQRILTEKVGNKQVSLGAAEDALKEAESNLNAAQEDLKAAELERDSLLPQYERCQQNRDHHKVAEKLKNEISKAEEELRAADSKIRGLEDRLQAVSVEYKRERERRSMLVSRISVQVEELGRAVEEKVALTFPIDEAENSNLASSCLQRLMELFREREMELQQWNRHRREIDAIIEMKRQRAVDLRLEADRHMAVTASAKDQEIKALILKFQEERESLLIDIESTKQQNADQLQMLHRTKVLAPKEVTLSDPSAKPQRRELAAPTTNVFAQRTNDLEKEKEEVVEKIKTSSSEKLRLLKATQELKKQMEVEQKKFSLSLQNLESHILNERHQIAELEQENSKLEEMCEAMRLAVRVD